jgi:hypothetical protein
MEVAVSKSGWPRKLRAGNEREEIKSKTRIVEVVMKKQLKGGECYEMTRLVRYALFVCFRLPFYFAFRTRPPNYNILVHNKCSVNAHSMHNLCTVRVQLLHHLYIIDAQLVRMLCTTYAQRLRQLLKGSSRILSGGK